MRTKRIVRLHAEPEPTRPGSAGCLGAFLLLFITFLALTLLLFGVPR